MADAELDHISEALELSSTKRRLAGLRSLQELLSQQGSRFSLMDEISLI